MELKAEQGDKEREPKFERKFYFETLPAKLGEAWLQLLEPQREMTSIINQDADFTKQRVDFALQYPYKIKGKDGLIIEIDEEHHKEQAQSNLDKRRDDAVADHGWEETLRITVENSEFINLDNKLSVLRQLALEPYFKTIIQNYSSPLYDDKDGKKALQLILSPFAIARLQKVLVHHLLQDKLSLNSENSDKWKIAVYERDVPCAAIAIADLKSQLENIYALQGKKFETYIDLTIFSSEEFKDASLHSADVSEQITVHNADIKEINPDEKYDLFFVFTQCRLYFFHMRNVQQGSRRANLYTLSAMNAA